MCVGRDRQGPARLKTIPNLQRGARQKETGLWRARMAFRAPVEPTHVTKVARTKAQSWCADLE